MSKQTFAERCQIAQQLLPYAQYRAMLTALHTEMLAALAAQPKREWVSLTDEELIAAIYALEGFAFGLDDGNVSDGEVLMYARIVEAKLKEKNT